MTATTHKPAVFEMYVVTKGKEKLITTEMIKAVLAKLAQGEQSLAAAA